MDTDIQKAIIAAVKNTAAIKLLYFFGSRSRGTAGPLSDYDFAVFTDKIDKKKRDALRASLIAKLTKVLGTDAVDVVIINDAGSPELKYSIINEGMLLYEREPYRVIVEPLIMNDYFDFRQGLLRYGLTKA